MRRLCLYYERVTHLSVDVFMPIFIRLHATRYKFYIRCICNSLFQFHLLDLTTNYRLYIMHVYLAIPIVIGLLSSPTRAALYESVIQTPNGPVQGYPAFNNSVAGLNITNWQKVTV